MVESRTSKIQKTVIFDEEGVTIDELLLSKVGEDLFRIEESTVMVESASYGDTIQAEELDDGNLLFVKVTEKSIFNAHNFLLTMNIVNSPSFQSFLEKVINEGGHWERAFGGILNIYLPKSSKLNPELVIEEIYENQIKR